MVPHSETHTKLDGCKLCHTHRTGREHHFLEGSDQPMESLLCVCLFATKRFEVNSSFAFLRDSHIKSRLHTGGDNGEMTNTPLSCF